MELCDPTESIDLVFEGEAARVTDRPTLEQVVAIYSGGGWPAQLDGDAFTAPFSAPSAGPPPWPLYRFTFHTAFGVATAEPYGATRWRFVGRHEARMDAAQSPRQVPTCRAARTHG